MIPFYWEWRYRVHGGGLSSMKTTVVPLELNVRIAATLGAIDDACARIGTFLHEQGMDRWRFEVILLAREALTNAVVHGCRLKATDQVQLVLVREGPQLVMTVTDPGPGFDWRAQRDEPVDPADEHGRGLSIFRCYAAEYSYNDRGNQVTLRKAVGNEEAVS
jgi:serine/threonine-protein kinase RsbW